LTEIGTVLGWKLATALNGTTAPGVGLGCKPDPLVDDEATEVGCELLAAPTGVTIGTGVGVGSKVTPPVDGAAKPAGRGDTWLLAIVTPGVAAVIAVIVGCALAAAVGGKPNVPGVDVACALKSPLDDVISGIGVGLIWAVTPSLDCVPVVAVVGEGFGCELAGAPDDVVAATGVGAGVDCEFTSDPEFASELGEGTVAPNVGRM
jgi:hypothetical protein